MCRLEQATFRGEPSASICWSTSAPYRTRSSMHSDWPMQSNKIHHNESWCTWQDLLWNMLTPNIPGKNMLRATFLFFRGFFFLCFGNFVVTELSWVSSTDNPCICCGMWPLTFGCSPVDWRACLAGPHWGRSILKKQWDTAHVSLGAGFCKSSLSIHGWSVHLCVSMFFERNMKVYRLSKCLQCCTLYANAC